MKPLFRAQEQKLWAASGLFGFLPGILFLVALLLGGSSEALSFSFMPVLFWFYAFPGVACFAFFGILVAMFGTIFPFFHAPPAFLGDIIFTLGIAFGFCISGVFWTCVARLVLVEPIVKMKKL